MRTYLSRTLAILVLAITPCLEAAHLSAPPTQKLSTSEASPAEVVAAKTIEVCFVLDTTGSMSGLIEGAKAKIWSISNELLKSSSPAPVVRIALVGYRDRGDEYITRVFDLTDDIDAVYKNLMTFSAGGGGDGPESVNQALAESLSKVSWTKAGAGADVTRMVFLVGDAPPHMDYSNDVAYPATCAAAAKAEITINAVQCGSEGQTETIWKEISKLSEGSFIRLEQSGGMTVVASPYDDEITKLSAKVDATVLPYGSREQQREVTGKAALAATAPSGAAADRAIYNAGSGRGVQGRGDLVRDLKDGSVKLEALPAEELPAPLQKLSPAEQKTKVEALAKERAELQDKIAALSQKRDAFQRQEQERLRQTTGKTDAFDAKVAEVVREQVNRKR